MVTTQTYTLLKWKRQHSCTWTSKSEVMFYQRTHNQCDQFTSLTWQTKRETELQWTGITPKESEQQGIYYTKGGIKRYFHTCTEPQRFSVVSPEEKYVWTEFPAWPPGIQSTETQEAQCFCWCYLLHESGSLWLGAFFSSDEVWVWLFNFFNTIKTHRYNFKNWETCGSAPPFTPQQMTL